MFITPCFIRKNTPELINKLIDLGYVKALFDEEYTKSEAYGLIVDQGDIAPLEHGIQEMELMFTYNFVDCGTNEDLFFALAALRDDTNENQWFIAQRTMWDENYNGEITVYYEEGEWLMWDYYSFMEDMPSDFRKATVEEIIAHFNH